MFTIVSLGNDPDKELSWTSNYFHFLLGIKYSMKVPKEFRRNFDYMQFIGGDLNEKKTFWYILYMKLLPGSVSV